MTDCLETKYSTTMETSSLLWRNYIYCVFCRLNEIPDLMKIVNGLTVYNPLWIPWYFHWMISTIKCTSSVHINESPILYRGKYKQNRCICIRCAANFGWNRKCLHICSVVTYTKNINIIIFFHSQTLQSDSLICKYCRRLYINY